MRKSDIAKLLAIFSAAYPSFEVTKDRRDLWWSIFKDDSLSIVEDAVKQYITMHPSDFAPTPGQVLALMPHPGRTHQKTREEKEESKKRIFERIKRDYEEGWATIVEHHNEKEDRLYTVPIGSCIQIGFWKYGKEAVPRYGLLFEQTDPLP